MDNSQKPEIPVDYVSDFEYAESTASSEAHKNEIYKKPKSVKGSLVNEMKKEQYEKDYIKHQSASYRAHIISMDKLTRHKKLVNDYLLTKGKYNEAVSDEDSVEPIESHQRFLWHDGDENESWGSRLAKKYWERLVKEYVLIDLSRYQQNKFGMRWRRQQEVVAGKGQFSCANIDCDEVSELASWQVKFNYVEKQEKRSALVKVRLCPICSSKLNYRHKRPQVIGKPDESPQLNRKRMRLRSPVPFDDDIMDQDSFHNMKNMDQMKSTLKRARKESSRSLTEDEDDSYSSGAESLYSGGFHINRFDSHSVKMYQRPLSPSCDNSASNNRTTSINRDDMQQHENLDKAPDSPVSSSRNDSPNDRTPPVTNDSKADSPVSSGRNESPSNRDSSVKDNIGKQTTSPTCCHKNDSPNNGSTSLMNEHRSSRPEDTMDLSVIVTNCNQTTHNVTVSLISSGASSPLSVSSIEDDSYTGPYGLSRVARMTLPISAIMATHSNIQARPHTTTPSIPQLHSNTNNPASSHKEDFEPFIEELFP